MRMTMIAAACLAALAASVSGLAAHADPIDIQLRLIDEQGEPRAAFPLRIVVVDGASALAPDAGVKMTTDADGRIAWQTQAAVETRAITLDNPLAKHEARHITIGVELALIDRPALYLIELDLLKDGTLGKMTANVAATDGLFDDPLVFDDASHAWSMPDRPNGMLMTSIGAELTSFDLARVAEGWTVDIEVEKQEFTVR